MGIDQLSIIAAIISTVLGVLAIWLSTRFYFASVRTNTETREVLFEMKHYISGIEKLFGTFYSDTFSMMKETYSDIRKHAWQVRGKDNEQLEGQIESKVEIVVDHLKTEMDEKLSSILQKQIKDNIKTNELKSEIESLMSDLLVKTRKAEIDAKENTIREFIIQALMDIKRDNIIALDIVNTIIQDYPTVTSNAIIKELQEMRKEKIIEWVGHLKPLTEINIKGKNK